jgi:hypothetical protein
MFCLPPSMRLTTMELLVAANAGPVSHVPPPNNSDRSGMKKTKE